MDTNEIPVVTNAPVWTGPSAEAENGWRKDERWRYHNGGQWGDDAIAGYTSYYSKPSDNWFAEISYYVETASTDNLPEVRDAFVVECQVYMYRRDGDEGEPFEEDYEYDYGDVRYFDTFEQAFEQAERLASANEAYAFDI